VSCNLIIRVTHTVCVVVVKSVVQESHDTYHDKVHDTSHGIVHDTSHDIVHEIVHDTSHDIRHSLTTPLTT